MAQIEITELTKAYGRFVALDAVSLSIRDGEFLTLLGPSGSGKTTLLMSLAGFIRPDSGSILVNGEEIVARAPHRRDIGMVFQNYALFPHMSVGENVAYPLKLRGVGRAEREARALAALDMVQLKDRSARRIDQLSGGQRQRVAVARAIVFEPSIILMDEPLSALDKKLREEMQIELRHLHNKLQRTTIYVTHDQKEALTMSDRVAVMNQGRVEQIATPQVIYETPATRFVADFLGDSIFVPVAPAAPGVTLHCTEGFHRAQIAALQHPLLVVRPEKLELADPMASMPGQIYFDTVVTEILFQGDAMVLCATLPDGRPIRLKRGTRHQTRENIPAVGSPARLALHEGDASTVEDAA